MENATNEARRTRETRYFNMPDGSVKSMPNELLVTQHSFVLSHPVEYKKKRVNRAPKKAAPKKAAPKKAAPKLKKKAPARVEADVEAINADGPEQLPRVYSTIDLESSSVPKPIAVVSQERMGMSKNHSNRLHSTFFMLDFFFSRRQTNCFTKAACP